MCGRYSLGKPKEAFEDHFGVAFPDTGRFDVAPSQAVPVIRDGVSMLRWGLVPFWSKEPKAYFSNISARAETVARSLVRRCLMPSDGFFEWAVGPSKVPH